MDHRIKSEGTYEDGVSAQPIVFAAWRGRFNIPSRSMDIRVSAHVSDKASSQIWDVTSNLPELLYLEVLPLIDLWPSTFLNSQPNEQTISLFFFPEERDKKALESLLTDAVYAKYGLKAVLGKSELVVFTSLQLPERLHRFQGKPYFWGVFKDQGAASSRQLDSRALMQKHEVEQDLSSNSGNQMRFEGQGSPMTISINHDQLISTGRSERRGRRLDDAWEHAKPLDELRQKAECKYCSFVSWHGGISRLKAHLGGGHPRIHLPGCDNVPPQVKKTMANWFNDWLKTTKAVWTKEIREHVMPFDVSQKTEHEPSCFGSSHVGTPQFRVHLGGQELKMRIDSSSGELSETKAVTSKWMRNMTSPIYDNMEEVKSGSFEISPPSKMKKKSLAGTQGDKKGRPLDDAWKNARALDEARQKTQCLHCGFVSMYGGISRLKAHLGGGSQEIQLQGCPKVPIEVKTVMEQWFSEWSITSNAVWVRKCSGYTGTPKPSKKARKLQDMLEHAIPLDEMGQRIKCRYCGYISEHGGIERIKAHLTGECPRMSLEVRNIIMSEGVKKHKKKLKGVQVDNFGRAFQEAERTANEAQWVEKRHHILQEAFDEVRNTSLKGSLKRLLNEKSGML